MQKEGGCIWTFSSIFRSCSLNQKLCGHIDILYILTPLAWRVSTCLAALGIILSLSRRVHKGYYPLLLRELFRIMKSLPI